MMKHLLLLILVLATLHVQAQNKMTPELLWNLGRVSGTGITKDGSGVVYTVSTPNATENKSSRKTFLIPITGGEAKEISDTLKLVADSRVSPDGQFRISAKDVKIKKVFGKDYYPDLPKSNAQIYDELNYRHWDEWEDGAFSHIFLHKKINGQWDEGKDLMPGQAYDSPQKPFVGDEDFIWPP